MFSNPFKRREVDFNEIPQEDCESLTSNAPSLEKSQQLPKRMYSITQVALLFLATFIISGLSGASTSAYLLKNSDENALNKISKYSPLLPDVDISFRTVQFNGSLLKENTFRQDAGPEVDAAWEALGVDYRASIVPAELAAKSGLGVDHVQVSDKYGGGFPANVEGLHHLHCLNLLRQSLYYNFDYYHAQGKGAFLNDDRILRFHVSHCLDILRQQLMCTVDIAVLGQVWWNQEKPTAYPDFNTKHTCRNFDDIRRWAEKHQAPADVPDDYLKKPNSLADIAAEIP